MRELLRPFAHLHVLAVAVLGCLALATLTSDALWAWLGLAGAAVGSLWAAILLYRDLHHPRR